MEGPVRKCQQNCRYCGRLYVADPRLDLRQKSCRRDTCRRNRKRESQKAWVQKNPDYFRGRYANTKAWREKHKDARTRGRRRPQAPVIQDAIPPASPMKSIRCLVPAELLKSGIQDACLVLTLMTSATYVGTVEGA